MLCCEYHFRCFSQVPLSPFLNMSYLEKGKLQLAKKRRGNDMIHGSTKRRYILIQDISRILKILKMRTLLKSRLLGGTSQLDKPTALVKVGFIEGECLLVSSPVSSNFHAINKIWKQKDAERQARMMLFISIHYRKCTLQYNYSKKKIRQHNEVTEQVVISLFYFLSVSSSFFYSLAFPIGGSNFLTPKN